MFQEGFPVKNNNFDLNLLTDWEIKSNENKLFSLILYVDIDF